MFLFDSLTGTFCLSADAAAEPSNERRRPYHTTVDLDLDLHVMPTGTIQAICEQRPVLLYVVRVQHGGGTSSTNGGGSQIAKWRMLLLKKNITCNGR